MDLCLLNLSHWLMATCLREQLPLPDFYRLVSVGKVLCLWVGVRTPAVWGEAVLVPVKGQQYNLNIAANQSWQWQRLQWVLSNQVLGAHGGSMGYWVLGGEGWWGPPDLFFSKQKGYSQIDPSRHWVWSGEMFPVIVDMIWYMVSLEQPWSWSLEQGHALRDRESRV